MRKEDCFELGVIRRPHGLDGEMMVELDVDDPELYMDKEVVFVEQKAGLVPYMVTYFHPHKGGFISRFQEVDSIEAAQKLAGARLFLPLSQLPPLADGQFYYHDIIGYQVADEAMGLLGTVETVYEADIQDLVVMRYKGHEVLIPITDTIVLRADHAQKQLITRLPEGLLEVYLNP